MGGLYTTEKPNSPCLVQKIRAYLCYIHRYLFHRSFPSLCSDSNPLRVHGASTAAVASIWWRDIGIAPQVLQLGGLDGRKPCFTSDMFQIACCKSGASCNTYLSHQWRLLCSWFAVHEIPIGKSARFILYYITIMLDPSSRQAAEWVSSSMCSVSGYLWEANGKSQYGDGNCQQCES